MYYIKFPGDNLNENIHENNQIGEISFNILWPSAGYFLLTKLIEDDRQDVLSTIQIVKFDGTILTPIEFMDFLITRKIKIKT